MGVKISQLPVAASIASNDYVPVLDTSEGVLKRTTISHASTGTAYGAGTTSNYGHVKLRNDLTRTSYADGEALSSYQGNVLAKDIGPLETGNTATAAHDKDTYFMWKGQFVKVTAAIAIGNTISTSTNVEVSSVSAILSELNSNIPDTDMILSLMYGLSNKITSITTSNGSTQITEVDSINNVTTVTTIENTSSTVTTITTVVTPDAGQYYYTKTTVISQTASGKSITENFVRNTK